MVKHFNACDVYKSRREFNIYTDERDRYINLIHSHSHFLFLKYLIDYKTIKNMTMRKDCQMMIFELSFKDIPLDRCSDSVRNFIGSIDEHLMEIPEFAGDYVWFLRENVSGGNLFSAMVIVFFHKEILPELSGISQLAQKIARQKNNLSDFQIHLPTVNAGFRKSLLMKYVGNGVTPLLLNSGFAASTAQK